MRVTNVQNGQNFGMSFKLKGAGAEALAKHFHSFSDPKAAEKNFVNEVVKPLSKLKSDVVYDGSNVVVHDAMSAKAFEVLDATPKFEDYKGKSVVNYLVNSICSNQKDGVYSKMYADNTKAPDMIKLATPGFERQFTIAGEIAKDLDSRIPTIESQKDTASRLKNLYA